MTIDLPPTIPTIYPLQSQSTPNLNNSFLISVGMYMYFITYFLILMTSPAAVFNSAINSFCPLDTTLVLTSDNSHSIFPPFPPFFLFLPLVSLIQNCHVAPFILCVHTNLLSFDCERSLWVSKCIVQVSMYLCLHTSSFFWQAFPILVFSLWYLYDNFYFSCRWWYMQLVKFASDILWVGTGCKSWSSNNFLRHCPLPERLSLATFLKCAYEFLLFMSHPYRFVSACNF